LRRNIAQNEGWEVNMTFRTYAPVVKHLPETLSLKEQRLFWGEIESCLNIDRPFIVLDCSRVSQMDRSSIHLLLCCLEEAMKRNGDVKLSAIPAGARALLEVTGVDRLFEIFETNADAVESFRRVPVGEALSADSPRGSRRGSENAA
jgi:anti-sigma B factor antagonist